MNTVKTFETLVANIKYYLESSGMTQSELAARLQTTPAAVSNWLNGKHAPGLDAIDGIAKTFGISVSDLLKDPEHTNPGYKSDTALIQRLIDLGPEALEQLAATLRELEEQEGE